MRDILLGLSLVANASLGVFGIYQERQLGNLKSQELRLLKTEAFSRQLSERVTNLEVIVQTSPILQKEKFMDCVRTQAIISPGQNPEYVCTPETPRREQR